MKFLIFSALLVFFIIPIIYIIRIIRSSKRKAQAQKEVELIILHLYQSDTFAELDFWDNEANLWLDKYSKKVPQQFLNISAKHLGTAYRTRYHQSFKK